MDCCKPTQQTIDSKPVNGFDGTKAKFTNFEDILIHIGQWGHVQRIQFTLLLTTVMGVAFHNMGMVFLAGKPQHHCLVDEQTINNTLPGKYVNGEMVYSQCEVFDLNSTAILPGNFTETVSCERAVGDWYYDKSDFGNTIVSEWNLVCESSWLAAFSKLIYFFGFLVGCFVISGISDRFGRRVTNLGCAITQTLFASSVYFSPNIIVFTTLRFVVGVASGGLTNTAYVLAQEWSTKNMRLQLQAISVFSWGFGNVLLGAIAYFVRDWRHIALATGVPLAWYIAVFWMVYPSPRWLLTQGRTREALEILHQAAKRNGKLLPEKLDLSLLHMKRERPSIIDLVRTPNMRKMSMIVWYSWFSVGLINYGMAYNVGNLFGNIYLNFILMALTQCVRVPFILLVNHFNRRYAIFIFAGICGASCIAVAIFTDGAGTASLVLTLIGQLTAGLCFAMMYVYTTEVNPTSIRTIGLGSASMWARVGSMISPFVVLLADRAKILPFVVFGCAAMLMAFLILLAPETHRRPLVDTVEDAERQNTIRFRCRDSLLAEDYEMDEKESTKSGKQSSVPLMS